MTDVPVILAGLAPMPEIDFAEFGEIETQPLNRIQQSTGALIYRNWVTIPHVTHHDEVDVTEAEQRRLNWNAAHRGTKLTPVVLLVRALALTLCRFPRFNASLTGDGKSLILKKYVNIGVAAGHIGGTGFTPIINAPDVAILGAAGLQTRAAPAADGGVAWRRMLPLSLSYAHRVINGADVSHPLKAIEAGLADAALFA